LVYWSVCQEIPRPVMFSLRDWWLIRSCPWGMIDLWWGGPSRLAHRGMPLADWFQCWSPWRCLDFSIVDPDASILVVRHYHQHLVFILFYFYFCCVRACDLSSSAFHYISCIHTFARLLDGWMWMEIQMILPMWVIMLDSDSQMWLEMIMILPMRVILLDLIWLDIIGALDDTPDVSDHAIL